jgi:hypothetical protein
MRIFLSHSHRDRAIAEALTKLFKALFGKRVEVEYSSDQTAGGGVPPGDQWLPWITRRITDADKTYVLLTPNSMHKPWVLWESGAAAGVALTAGKASHVVPVTFGLSDDDIPNPFLSTQCVRGDSRKPGGIDRLLQSVNRELADVLTDEALQSTMEACLPEFLAKVEAALRDAAPIVSLLASVPSSFEAARLSGLWVTCYDFKSGAKTLCHADVAELKAESARRLTGKNHRPPPRTDGHLRPFLNEVDAEVANRHVIGHWKNVSDTRYFGTIQLAVQTGENAMEGHYTCLVSDVIVGGGRWQWKRIDPATIAGVDLSQVVLREPRDIKKRLARHRKDAGPLDLATVIEP